MSGVYVLRCPTKRVFFPEASVFYELFAMGAPPIYTMLQTPVACHVSILP